MYFRSALRRAGFCCNTIYLQGWCACAPESMQACASTREYVHACIYHVYLKSHTYTDTRPWACARTHTRTHTHTHTYTHTHTHTRTHAHTHTHTYTHTHSHTHTHTTLHTHIHKRSGCREQTGGFENKVEGGGRRSFLVKMKFYFLRWRCDNVKCVIVTEWHRVMMGKRDIKFWHDIDPKTRISASLKYSQNCQKSPENMPSASIANLKKIPLTLANVFMESEQSVWQLFKKIPPKHCLIHVHSSQNSVPSILQLMLICKDGRKIERSQKPQ